jgi:hypothetical protein
LRTTSCAWVCLIHGAEEVCYSKKNKQNQFVMSRNARNFILSACTTFCTPYHARGRQLWAMSTWCTVQNPLNVLLMKLEVFSQTCLVN